MVNNRIVINVCQINEYPAQIKPNTICIVNDDDFGNKYLLFLCPCGCRAKIILNLIVTNRPLWTLTINNDGTITVNPSVLQLVDCKAHFWIRNNQIIWC